MNIKDRRNLGDCLYWMRAGMYTPSPIHQRLNLNKVVGILEDMIVRYDADHPMKKEDTP